MVRILARLENRRSQCPIRFGFPEEKERCRIGFANHVDFQHNDLMKQSDRITFNPRQCGGKPCIRGMRIRVSDILDMLAEGVSEKRILADFPDLEDEDIKACLKFAAKRVNISRLVA